MRLSMSLSVDLGQHGQPVAGANSGFCNYDKPDLNRACRAMPFIDRHQANKQTQQAL